MKRLALASRQIVGAFEGRRALVHLAKQGLIKDHRPGLLPPTNYLHRTAAVTAGVSKGAVERAYEFGKSP